jgi:TetR/AcrR family transcriptional regulator, regulator of cefoperazone and chloramphenicol sensitivity
VRTVTDDRDTQARLVVAAARLFARHGIEAVPMRDVVSAAGARNASAVQYHFGGRWELVAAVLARHADAVTAGDGAYDDASLAGIVETLVALLRPKLADPEGRDFLRVVFELMMRYPGRWDTPATHRGMTRLVARVVALLDPLPPRVARARAVAMTQHVTQQMAERARRIDDGGRNLLGEETFVANLTAMSLAMLTAPPPAPRRRR